MTMRLTANEVMRREFLEIDLDDAIGILKTSLQTLQTYIVSLQISHVLSEEDGDDRLRLVRRELRWLTVYACALKECRSYCLDDVQSQLDRSQKRLATALSFQLNLH